MNELEKVLKDVVYGSVGAVATAIEVGQNITKAFVEKGQEAVRHGQESVEELKKAVKDACEAAQSDPCMDITHLNRAQRDTLRRMLDEMDAAEEAAAQAEAEAAGDDCACPVTYDAAPEDEDAGDAAAEADETDDLSEDDGNG